MRTIDEVEEEVDRINGITSKKRSNADNSGVNQKAMSLLKIRFGDYAFGAEAISSFGSNESNMDEINERQRKKNPFNDITEAFQEISDDEEETRYKIEIDKNLAEIGPNLLKSRRSSLLK